MKQVMKPGQLFFHPIYSNPDGSQRIGPVGYATEEEATREADKTAGALASADLTPPTLVGFHRTETGKLE